MKRSTPTTMAMTMPVARALATATLAALHELLKADWIDQPEGYFEYGER